MKTAQTRQKTVSQASKLAYMPRTTLGRRLWTLRQKYIAEGGKLLNWAELEKEVAQRKGQSE